MSLALDDNDLNSLVDVRGISGVISSSFWLHRKLPEELGNFFSHYVNWNTLWGMFIEGTADLLHVREALFTIDAISSTKHVDHIYYKEDSDHLRAMLGNPRRLLTHALF
jgi:hypothetical protein